MLFQIMLFQIMLSQWQALHPALYLLVELSVLLIAVALWFWCSAQPAV